MVKSISKIIVPIILIIAAVGGSAYSYIYLQRKTDLAQTEQPDLAQTDSVQSKKKNDRDEDEKELKLVYEELIDNGMSQRDALKEIKKTKEENEESYQIEDNIEENFEIISNWKIENSKNEKQGKKPNPKPILTKLRDKNGNILQNPEYVKAISDLDKLMNQKGGKTRKHKKKHSLKKRVNKGFKSRKI